MTQTEMFGAARWVSPDGACDTPYIRGEFSLENDIAAAEIIICGLGFFELYLNGRRVSEDKFVPVNSDFHAYPEQECFKAFGEVTSHRIYAVKYDIKAFLKKKNCIGVLLAPGWYKNEYCAPYGEVKLCFRIRVTAPDGSIAEVLSGDWLKWAQSPITSYSFHHGETQDFNAVRLDGWNKTGFDGGEWHDLALIDAPETRYFLQDCPADKVIRRIAPTLVGETAEGYIYDAGENVSGTPVIRARHGGVETIIMTASERLDENGGIEEYTRHGQRSVFITDGQPREYALRMTWYGFRYVMVSKNAEVVGVDVIHADVPVTSGFTSDNTVLNWIYDTCVRTQLDNMHAGIPSDCPHLERLGYTGDGELMCETAMLLLDAKRFYRKWLEDIADSQDTVSGHVQYTAPYFRCGGGPGGWGSAIIEVPYTYYQLYGDRTVLEEFLPRTLKYFDYLDSVSEDDLVVTDQPGLWCLGDWCTPEEIAIPAPFVNNYFYIKSIDRAMETAELLGKTALKQALAARREKKAAALVKAYFDPATGDFAGNVQGANAFAVERGLGDERTLLRMVRHYEEQTLYDTGIFGTDIVTRVLFDKGYDRLAFELLTSKGKYGFYHWMVNGCTTFPEYWTFKRSQNHPMFGAVTKYLFTRLLGIQNAAAGFEKLVIEPHLVKGLDQASGFITAAPGRIAVAYEKSGSEVSFVISVPRGTEAVFRCRGFEKTLEAGENRFAIPAHGI